MDQLSNLLAPRVTGSELPVSRADAFTGRLASGDFGSLIDRFTQTSANDVDLPPPSYDDDKMLAPHSDLDDAKRDRHNETKDHWHDDRATRDKDALRDNETDKRNTDRDDRDDKHRDTSDIPTPSHRDHAAPAQSFSGDTPSSTHDGRTDTLAPLPHNDRGTTPGDPSNIHDAGIAHTQHPDSPNPGGNAANPVSTNGNSSNALTIAQAALIAQELDLAAMTPPGLAAAGQSQTPLNTIPAGASTQGLANLGGQPTAASQMTRNHAGTHAGAAAGALGTTASPTANAAASGATGPGASGTPAPGESSLNAGQSGGQAVGDGILGDGLSNMDATQADLPEPIPLATNPAQSRKGAKQSGNQSGNQPGTQSGNGAAGNPAQTGQNAKTNANTPAGGPTRNAGHPLTIGSSQSGATLSSPMATGAPTSSAPAPLPPLDMDGASEFASAGATTNTSSGAATSGQTAATRAQSLSPGPRIDQNTLAALAARFAKRAVDGTSQFTIRLDPPELGRVNVQLDMGADGQAQARMVVERPETLAELTRHMRQLERALNEAGVSITQDDVEITLAEEDEAGFAGAFDDLAEHASDEAGTNQTDANSEEANTPHHASTAYDAATDRAEVLTPLGYVVVNRSGVDVHI